MFFLHHSLGAMFKVRILSVWAQEKGVFGVWGVFVNIIRVMQLQSITRQNLEALLLHLHLNSALLSKIFVWADNCFDINQCKFQAFK